MTPELRHLLRHVAAMDPQATLGEAAELIDGSSDARLCLLCRAATPGPPAPYLHTGKNTSNRVVATEIAALSYSCALRRRVVEELDELELDHHYVQNGRLILGECGKVWVADVLASPAQAVPRCSFSAVF